MRVTEVSVKVGRTINCGSYESARVEVQMTAELDKDDDKDIVFEELYQDARAKLYRKIETMIQ